MTIAGQGSGEIDTDGFTQINLTGNNTITIGGGGSLRNLRVFCPTTHGAIAVHIVADDAWSEDFWGQNNVLDDVYIQKLQNENGTAINLSSYPSADTENAGLALNTFNDIQTQGFEYGIYMWSKDSTSYGGYTNGNTFNGVTMTDIKYGIVLDSHSTGACSGNTFDGVKIDPAGDTIDAIVLKRCWRNSFTNVLIYDWDAQGVYMLNISSSCSNNYFQMVSSDSSWILDIGTDNRIIYEDQDSLFSTLKTKIWNSNGNSYPTTATGLQDAFNNLNNISGFVVTPKSNITHDNSYRIPADCKLIGYDTTLYLTNSANVTMLRNYTGETADNIYITGITFNGNCLNQPAYYTAAHQNRRTKHIIDFRYGDNITIENCRFLSSTSAAIYTQGCDNIKISKCDIIGAGEVYEGEGNYEWFAGGIFLYDGDDATVTQCYFEDIFGTCLTFGYDEYATPDLGRCVSGLIVSDCIFKDSFAGLWLEQCENVTATNCISYDMTKTEAYADGDQNPIGFIAGGNTKNCAFTNCQAWNNGDSGDNKGGNFYTSGSEVTLIGCVSSDSVGYGYYLGSYSIMTGCVSDTDRIGLYTYGTGNIITGCRFESNTVTTTWMGAMYLSAYMDNDECTTVSDCFFDDSAGNAIMVEMDDVIITGCHFEDIGRSAIASSTGTNLTIINNYASDITGHGFELITSEFSKIAFNTIYNCGQTNSGIYLSAVFNSSIIGNIIMGKGTQYPDIGIECVGGTDSDYNRIMFNTFDGVTTEISSLGTNSRVNCTGYDDWNFYTGVS
jgi:hypothetical protein